jgi:hypothetical protein
MPEPRCTLYERDEVLMLVSLEVFLSVPPLSVQAILCLSYIATPSYANPFWSNAFRPNAFQYAYSSFPRSSAPPINTLLA